VTEIPLWVSSIGILALIALGFGTAIAAVGRSYDSAHLRSWRTAWFALGVHALLSGTALLAVGAPALAPFRPGISVLSLLAAWAHLYYLHEGMWGLCRPAAPLPAWRQWIPALALRAARTRA
jgi:hypothetical protein